MAPLRDTLVVAFVTSLIFVFLAFNQWHPDLAWGESMLWAIFISAVLAYFFGFEFLKRYPLGQGESQSGMAFMVIVVVIAFIGFLIPQPPLYDWFLDRLGSAELTIGFAGGLFAGMAGTLYAFFTQG
jgi:hypothetical protein